MAPRDPIVLKLPNDAQMVPEGVQQEEQEGSRFSGGMGQLAARTRDHRGALSRRPRLETAQAGGPYFPAGKCGPPAFCVPARRAYRRIYGARMRHVWAPSRARPSP